MPPLGGIGTFNLGLWAVVDAINIVDQGFQGQGSLPMPRPGQGEGREAEVEESVVDIEMYASVRYAVL